MKWPQGLTYFIRLALNEHSFVITSTLKITLITSFLVLLNTLLKLFMWLAISDWLTLNKSSGDIQIKSNFSNHVDDNLLLTFEVANSNSSVADEFILEVRIRADPVNPAVFHSIVNVSIEEVSSLLCFSDYDNNSFVTFSIWTYHGFNFVSQMIMQVIYLKYIRDDFKHS